MIDKPNLIEQVKSSFQKQVEVAKSLGLTYLEIHRILLCISLGLCLKGEAELWLNLTEKER